MERAHEGVNKAIFQVPIDQACDYALRCAAFKEAYTQVCHNKLIYLSHKLYQIMNIIIT